MPSKRRSEAAVILNFFRTAKLDTAQFTFDLVKDVMRERTPKEEKKPAKASGSKKPAAAAVKKGNKTAAVAQTIRDTQQGEPTGT